MKIHLVAFGIARGPVDVGTGPASTQLIPLVSQYPEYDSTKGIKIMDNSAKAIGGTTSLDRAGVREGDVIIVNQ